MKLTILSLLLFTGLAHGKVLESPENCYAKLQTPCLTKIVDEDVIFRFGKTKLRLQKDSVVQWKTFDDVSLDLLKGRIHVVSNHSPFRVNEIFIIGKSGLIERNDSQLQILELKKFLLSSHAIDKNQIAGATEKYMFLEKMELLQFAAQFFDRKKQFVTFLKDIEKPWKKEFLAQTKNQTKVLERSVASAAQAEKIELEERRILTDELKRVRELFFYRTFFR